MLDTLILRELFPLLLHEKRSFVGPITKYYTPILLYKIHRSNYKREIVKLVVLDVDLQQAHV